jgi:N-acyl-phosphatidylethanolamine-hydrolysing phospholipase D
MNDDESESGLARASRPHHRPGGGFRNPWPSEADGAREPGAFLRWQVERWKNPVAPNPPESAFPRVSSDVSYPRVRAGEVRATWVGHASFLLQVNGWNVLTDPVWSRRVSPVRWAGPARLTRPGLRFEALPPVDAVLISHDHFDHLDRPTIARIHRRHGERVRWITPLGYGRWFATLGIAPVIELDWWERVSLTAEDRPPLEVVALPARHWTKRSFFADSDRLWAGFGLLADDGARVYFAGDSGYFTEFGEIGRRVGPFDLSLIPIGAYEPRWFMAAAHMNPEEAVQTYRDAGGRGIFGGMHWGTFRLTDESPLEPPVRARQAWLDAGLPIERLWIPRHGETRVIRLDRD